MVLPRASPPFQAGDLRNAVDHYIGRVLDDFQSGRASFRSCLEDVDDVLRQSSHAALLARLQKLPAPLSDSGLSMRVVQKVSACLACNAVTPTKDAHEGEADTALSSAEAVIPVGEICLASQLVRLWVFVARTAYGSGSGGPDPSMIAGRLEVFLGSGIGGATRLADSVTAGNQTGDEGRHAAAVAAISVADALCQCLLWGLALGLLDRVQQSPFRKLVVRGVTSCCCVLRACASMPTKVAGVLESTAAVLSSPLLPWPILQASTADICDTFRTLALSLPDPDLRQVARLVVCHVTLMAKSPSTASPTTAAPASPIDSMWDTVTQKTVQESQDALTLLLESGHDEATEAFALPRLCRLAELLTDLTRYFGGSAIRETIGGLKLEGSHVCGYFPIAACLELCRGMQQHAVQAFVQRNGEPRPATDDPLCGLATAAIDLLDAVVALMPDAHLLAQADLFRQLLRVYDLQSPTPSRIDLLATQLHFHDLIHRLLETISTKLGRVLLHRNGRLADNQLAMLRLLANTTVRVSGSNGSTEEDARLLAHPKLAAALAPMAFPVTSNTAKTDTGAEQLGAVFLDAWRKSLVSTLASATLMVPLPEQQSAEVDEAVIRLIWCATHPAHLRTVPQYQQYISVIRHDAVLHAAAQYLKESLLGHAGGRASCYLQSACTALDAAVSQSTFLTHGTRRLFSRLLRELKARFAAAATPKSISLAACPPLAYNRVFTQAMCMNWHGGPIAIPSVQPTQQPYGLVLQTDHTGSASNAVQQQQQPHGITCRVEGITSGGRGTSTEPPMSDDAAATSTDTSVVDSPVVDDIVPSYYADEEQYAALPHDLYYTRPAEAQFDDAEDLDHSDHTDDGEGLVPPVDSAQETVAKTAINPQDGTCMVQMAAVRMTDHTSAVPTPSCVTKDTECSGSTATTAAATPPVAGQDVEHTAVPPHAAGPHATPTAAPRTSLCDRVPQQAQTSPAARAATNDRRPSETDSALLPTGSVDVAAPQEDHADERAAGPAEAETARSALERDGDATRRTTERVEQSTAAAVQAHEPGRCTGKDLTPRTGVGAKTQDATNETPQEDIEMHGLSAGAAVVTVVSETEADESPVGQTEVDAEDDTSDEDDEDDDAPAFSLLQLYADAEFEAAPVGGPQPDVGVAAKEGGTLPANAATVLPAEGLNDQKASVLLTQGLTDDEFLNEIGL